MQWRRHSGDGCGLVAGVEEMLKEEALWLCLDIQTQNQIGRSSLLA
jgi:hypothetical protein